MPFCQGRRWGVAAQGVVVRTSAIAVPVVGKAKRFASGGVRYGGLGVRRCELGVTAHSH